MDSTPTRTYVYLMRFSLAFVLVNLSGVLSAQTWKRVFSSDSVFSLEVHPDFHKELEGPFETLFVSDESTIWVRRSHASQESTLHQYVESMMTKPGFTFTRESKSVAFAKGNSLAKTETVWMVSKIGPDEQLYFITYGGLDLPREDVMHVTESFQIHKDHNSMIRYLDKSWVWYDELQLAIQSDWLLMPIAYNKLGDMYDLQVDHQQLTNCYTYQVNSPSKLWCLLMRFTVKDSVDASLEAHARHYQNSQDTHYEVQWGEKGGKKSLLIKNMVGHKEDPMGMVQYYFSRGKSLYKLVFCAGVDMVDDDFRYFESRINTTL